MNTNCDRTTNNFYFQCPAKMQDGRLFTNYEPRRDYHLKLRENLNLDNQKDLRMNIQTNRNSHISNIEKQDEKRKCLNPGLILPPPEKVYRVTKEGIEYIDTNLENGVGIMEESQWNEIQKMKVTKKNE